MDLLIHQKSISFKLEVSKKVAVTSFAGCALIRKAWKKLGSPRKLTLDLDTMIIETDKDEALYCYEKRKAYQPMNAYCPELGMVLAHEFRDGNISPMEWCADAYRPDTSCLPSANPFNAPLGPQSSQVRVQRSGDWDTNDRRCLQVAYRNRHPPSAVNRHFGARLFGPA